MTNIFAQPILRMNRKKGFSPVEVLVFSLCEERRAAEEILKEITAKDGDVSGCDKFDRCLEILKQRGLIVF